MSMFKVLPCLIMSACLSGAIAPAVLAQTLERETSLAQAATVTTLESQPGTAADLEIDDLTDEQVTQIEAIFATYQPQIEAATADYMMALDTMNNLLVPTTADLALTDAHNNVVTTEQALNNLVFQRNLALRSVLTLDQRQVINDYLRAYLGLAPAEPMLVFPDNLVGQDVDTALDTLFADGWVVVVTTPSEIQLDRGPEELNLALNRSGQVIDVELRD
jgi:Spy/CpxP family protein refolding chaperone